VGDRVAGVPLQAVAGGLMLRFHCANLVFFFVLHSCHCGSSMVAQDMAML
jgi:hypothetical protein